MNSKNQALLEMEALFDLNRIANLSATEKFNLIDLIGLVYQEAQYAKQVGLLKLDQSPRLERNKTFKLYLMLLSKGTKFSMLKRIIRNYALTFDQSDVYYAQTAILGIGAMMIDKEFDATSIYNYLMHLLGHDFLVENQKYNGLVEITDDSELDVSREIDYRAFEGDMRKVKYDILALLKYSYQHGLVATAELINQKYDNDEFILFFNMLNIPCAVTRQHMFENCDAHENPMRRLLLNGAYELINQTDLFTAHYLFNSIIGKYSRYEKDTTEVEAETDANLAKILEA